MASNTCVFIVFTALCLVASSAAPTDSELSLLKIPASCAGEQFCSVKPEGYDELEEKINSVLPDFLAKDYADRNGPDMSEEPMLSPEEDWDNCPYITKRQSMFLYNHGGNSSKIDVFVQTKLFRQYVDIVTCATEHIDTTSDEQCFKGVGISALQMKSKCQAGYAKRTLYVYDIKTSKVVQKSYEVPACCKCKVEDFFD